MSILWDLEDDFYNLLAFKKNFCTHLDIKYDVVVLDAISVHLFKVVVFCAILVKFSNEVKHRPGLLKLYVESEGAIILPQVHVGRGGRVDDRHRVGRSHQPEQFLRLVGAPLPWNAVWQRHHGLVHLPADDLELADVDVVDGHLGEALLGGGVGSGSDLQQEAASLRHVHVEVGLLPASRHHDEAAQGELAPWRLHACAACLEVCQRVVEADVLLAVQVEIGLALVVAVDSSLHVSVRVRYQLVCGCMWVIT